MEGWPKPGVPVRLVVKTWSGKVEHSGLALPSSGPKLITMKLQNGYNVSFPESYVDSFEVLEDVPHIEETAGEIEPQDETLPLVHLIHTGGTIASKVDYATGAVTARFDPHELLDAVPDDPYLFLVSSLRVHVHIHRTVNSIGHHHNNSSLRDVIFKHHP